MKRVLAAASLGVGLVVASGSAGAQSIIRQPGQHDHSIEIEVHGVLNWWGWGWGHAWSGGFGAGVRVGIPIMNNGFVSSINNDVRINFGADIVHWPNWNGWGFWYSSIYAPVALQWNFYFTQRFSLFAEAGLSPAIFIDHSGNCGRGGFCPGWNWWYLYPGTAVGFRVHGSGDGYPSFTLRLGFPTGLNLGVSF